MRITSYLDKLWLGILVLPKWDPRQICRYCLDVKCRGPDATTEAADQESCRCHCGWRGWFSGSIGSYMFSTTKSSGWWFGTCFIFPYTGNKHPNWLIFFRGVEITNQSFFRVFPGSMCPIILADQFTRIQNWLMPWHGCSMVQHQRPPWVSSQLWATGLPISGRLWSVDNPKPQWITLPYNSSTINQPLVGGLEHFLFFNILGRIIPTD